MDGVISSAESARWCCFTVCEVRCWGERAGSGLSCGPVGDLDRLFADFVADGTFEGGVEPFTLSGSELTAGFGDGATFTSEEAGALAVFDCGDLQL